MIEINNLTNEIIQKKFLEKIAQTILKKEKKEKLELSIAIVSAKQIRELNKKYRKKNQPTDVLSFQYGNSGLASLRSGEIIICLQEVKKNAKRFNSTVKKELAKVLIHGILHLFGYDHEKNKKRAEKMREKENYYLTLVK